MDLEIVLSQFWAQEEVREGRDYLLKLHSLKNQKQFDLVNKFSKAYTSNNMKIVSSIITTSLDKNTDEPCIFIGFKIVKKIAKASVRNKIRRRIKAIIRTIIKSEGYVHANQAFIIIPRTGILQKKYSDLEMEIGSAFKFLNKKIIDLNK